MNRNKLNERADIESALEMAVERGEAVANYRERTGHTGDSFGALKHAENKLLLENTTRRLERAYERHGVGSDRFNGTLNEYLWMLNATWYQNSHTALSEHREDMVTDLYIKMTDPANSDSGASIYSFKGVRDGKPVPVHRFVNSVFKTFFMEKDRTQRDYDFKHFRLIDDGAASSPIGDIRLGQLHKLAVDPAPPIEKPMIPASLASFGPEAISFTVEFESRSDAYLLIVGWLRKDADLSATKMAQMLRTMTCTVLDGAGEPMRVIEPMEINDRTVQRIKKEFFDGIRDISESKFREKEQNRKAAMEKIGLEYKVADTTDPEVLADMVYRSRMARAGKPVRNHPVETKKSRAEAQRADPNFIERTFSNDGPRFGGSRKRTNMDSDVDKDAGKIIS